jgi:hypothetical protein
VIDAWSTCDREGAQCRLGESNSHFESGDGSDVENPLDGGHNFMADTTSGKESDSGGEVRSGDYIPNTCDQDDPSSSQFWKQK